MSEENVELVRRVYSDWARGDFSQSAAFHPRVEFVMVDWPEGASARGLEEMRRAWRGALSAWEDFRAEAGDISDGGNQVVVMTNVSARGRGSGIDVSAETATVSAETATVWTIDAGQVVRLALYWNPAKAFEAARLE